MFGIFPKKSSDLVAPPFPKWNFRKGPVNPNLFFPISRTTSAIFQVLRTGNMGQLCGDIARMPHKSGWGQVGAGNDSKWNLSSSNTSADLSTTPFLHLTSFCFGYVLLLWTQQFDYVLLLNIAI